MSALKKLQEEEQAAAAERARHENAGVSPTSVQSGLTALLKLQNELRKKEAELEAREKLLREKEKSIEVRSVEINIREQALSKREIEVKDKEVALALAVANAKMASHRVASDQSKSPPSQNSCVSPNHSGDLSSPNNLNRLSSGSSVHSFSNSKGSASKNSDASPSLQTAYAEPGLSPVAGLVTRTSTIDTTPSMPLKRIDPVLNRIQDPPAIQRSTSGSKLENYYKEYDLHKHNQSHNLQRHSSDLGTRERRLSSDLGSRNDADARRDLNNKLDKLETKLRERERRYSEATGPSTSPTLLDKENLFTRLYTADTKV